MHLLTLAAETWYERPGLPGGTMSLVPFTPVDMALVESWLEMAHVSRFWPGGRGNPAERLERQRLRLIASMELDFLAPFMVRLDSDRIGFLMLRHMNAVPGWQSFDLPRESIGLDVLIGWQAMLARGHGRRAIRLGAEAALSDPSVRRLIADPHPQNLGAIAAFAAVGFADHGTCITPQGAAQLMVQDRPVHDLPVQDNQAPAAISRPPPGSG
jgi:aminoglycoside 6'-N-acetyltransferase